MESSMTATTIDRRTGIPNWSVLLLTMAVAVLWIVTFEGGAVSQGLGQAGSFLHELFHDGRHLLGVPCH
jgi:Probable cobalt transporter subunit (CbtB)